MTRLVGMARQATRPGPRGSDSDTRADILRAARKSFSEHGYRGTTLRGLARGAGVDVALIAYWFGSKEGVFTAAMDVPVDPAAIIEAAFADGAERAGPRLVGMFIDLWEGPETGPAMLTMFRSAATHEASRRALSEFAQTEILARYAARLPGRDAHRRAGLAASQLLGMAILRYLLQVEPFTTASRADLVDDLGPTVQRYLTGDLS
jgi:AcrR family transcriptional regulator